MSTVFRNFKSGKKPVDNNIIRDAHPNNAQYPWIPNRPFYQLTQPHERGTFFKSRSVSGAGAVGGPGGK